MFELKGGCFCGNLGVSVVLTEQPGLIKPRACDCDFCRKHAASYVSDALGSVVVRIRDEKKARKTRQGSGMAEFLLCGECGVLIGAFYQGGRLLHAAINVKSLDAGVRFDVDQVVSPQRLSTAEKTRRWSELWFREVTVVSECAQPPWEVERGQAASCN